MLDGPPAAPVVAASAAVPCREPFGGTEEATALAAELRHAFPGNNLPGAVITLPPPLTYLRPVTLPVHDLARARAIHLAELEGNLPIEDDEILSDLLPSAPGAPGTFLAVAARRSFVEKTVEAFLASGIRVDRVITDHVSLLLLAEGRIPEDAVLLSTFSDILLLRTSGEGVREARQFPSAMAEDPAELLSAVREASRENGDVTAKTFSFGYLPPALAGGLPDAAACDLPEGFPPAHLAACGAALAPHFPKVAGGFSLRTSMEAAAEKEREGRRRYIAAIAAGVAALLALGTLQFAKWTEGEKVARARALVRKEFAEAAPDIRNVVQAGAQIRAKLASLQRQQKELGTDAPPPADLLMWASQALPQGEIAVREVQIEGPRMRLAGETKDPRLVDTYRAGLSGTLGPGYAVTVQESEGSPQGTSVRFTILVERKAEPRVS